jgi:hypothetical protein
MIYCCSNGGIPLFRVPPKGKVEFTNEFKKLKKPFCIYADFESILENYQDPEQDQTKDNKNKTEKIKKHVPCSIGMCFQYSNIIIDEYYYMGLDSPDKFIDKLIEYAAIAKLKYDTYASKIITYKDESKSICIICNKKLFNFTWTYNICQDDFKTIGKSHISCCKKYYSSIIQLNIIMHNLKGNLLNYILFRI